MLKNYAESIQILPFIKKIASQQNSAVHSSLYPKWQELQKACRIFLNTEKDTPLIEIEENSGIWKVKPERVDLFS